MKIVIPISSADVHLLEDFTKTVKLLGGCPRQSIIFLPTRGLEAQAREAAGQLQFSAKSVTVIPWDRDNTGQWPLPGNIMWQHACIEISKQEQLGDAQPWYYMELDNTPMSPGWADKLEAEHAMSGCLYSGAVVPTRILVNGAYTTERHIPGIPENIPHMVGTGIYPVDIGRHTQGLWKFPKHDLPWDVYLRYVMNRSLHATKLIDHKWSTVNYKEVDGEIVCENSPTNPFGTDHAGKVDKNAVVVHGCKDGSLLKIVLAKYEGLNTEHVAPVVEEAAKPSLIEESCPSCPPVAARGPTFKLDRKSDSAFKNTQTLQRVIETTKEASEKKKRGRPRKTPELANA